MTTSIFITLYWDKSFYMHCDASNEAIWSILVEYITSNLNSPIYYASWFFIQVENNYITTKKNIRNNLLNTKFLLLFSSKSFHFLCESLRIIIFNQQANYFLKDYIIDVIFLII